MTYIEQTCAHDRRAHLVTDEVLVAALVDKTGRFSALCGHVVEASSLATPPGAACSARRAAAEPSRTRARRRRHLS